MVFFTDLLKQPTLGLLYLLWNEQNSQRLSWTREEVDGRLKDIMTNIFNTKTTAETYGLGKDYLAGANIAAFENANAMIAQGLV